jgi:amino acid adenylation domain-containing protein
LEWFPSSDSRNATRIFSCGNKETLHNPFIMTVPAIISALKSIGVVPRSENGQLKLIGATRLLTDELLHAIREAKQELLQFLAEAAAQSIFQPIPAIAVQPHYPLSPAQVRLWLLHQLKGASAAYTIVSAWHIQGDLQIESLKEGLKQLIIRHESLRTRFIEIDGLPRQVIDRSADPDFSYQDLISDNVSPENLTLILEEVYQQCLHHPFDMSRGPLFAIRLVAIAPKQFALFITLHHLISDGWSVAVLIKEWLAIYNTLNDKRSPALAPLTTSYPAYVQWIQQRLEQAEGQAAAAFWKEELAIAHDPLQLPLDGVRHDFPVFTGATHKHYLPSGTLDNWQLFCKKHHLNLYSLCRAALHILLSRLSGQARTTIGAPVAARNHSDLEALTGLFVNTLPLSAEVTASSTVLDWLHTINAHSQSALRYQDYPLDRIVALADHPRDPGRNPLFDILLVVQPNINGMLLHTNDGCQFTALDYKLYPDAMAIDRERAAAFDLSIAFGQEPGAPFFVEFNYATSLFSRDTIARWVTTYLHLIEQFIASPTQSLASLSLVTPAERTQILQQFNKPIVPVEAAHLFALLDPALQKGGTKIALKCGDQEWSYATLNNRVDAIAAFVKQALTGKTSRFVALLVQRSEWMPALLLGIIKAGAAYVPIDIQYPQSRIAYLLRDAAPAFVIADEKGESVLPHDYTGEYHLLSALQTTSVTKQLALPQWPDYRKEIAYLIYTSGSTGQPKGVRITHANVIAFLTWANAAFAQTPYEIAYATTSYCFDLSVFELFLPLLQGKTIRLLEHALAAPAHLDRDKAILLNTVPSVVRTWLAQEMDWTNVVALNMAGEAIPKSLKGKLDYHRMSVRNLYGPSEDTTYSTEYVFDDADYPTVPIGSPISNTQAYILDAQLQLQPIGVEGEIALSGNGVADGYHNLPELTTARFVANPFVPGMRMYLTGDKGKWLPDGKLLFSGRNDEQLKNRGYRIEPGEIQFLLEQYPGITQAVVTSATSEQESYLVAYWTGEATISPAALRNHIATQVPQWMIPDYWVWLNQIPLNSNGKVDKKRLPPPGATIQAETRQAVAPLTPLEEELLQIWKQILPIPTLGTTHHFFENGGNSLSAVKLRAAIAAELQKQLTLDDIFRYPTIVQQAKLLGDRGIADAPVIPKLPLQEDYPASMAQERLWVLTKLDKSAVAYHMPALFRISGTIDIALLEAAFAIVIDRHEILRTAIIEKEGQPRQLIAPVRTTRFVIDTITVMHTGSDALLSSLQEFWQAPFALEKGLLLRCAYVSTPGDNYLAFAMHHIISDGWSVLVLLQELVNACRQLATKTIIDWPPLSLQYKDISNWKRSYWSGKTSTEALTYWRNHFAEGIPILDLPTDYPRPAIKTYHGDAQYYNFSSDLSRDLTALAQKTKTTLFTVLQAAVQVLLHKYSRQELIVTGTALAGRTHPALQDQIGFYVNALPVRANFATDTIFGDLLKAQQAQLQEILAWQDTPFDLLVAALEPARDLSRSTLFDVMVIFQNFETQDQLEATELYPGVHIERQPCSAGTARYDLSFTFEAPRGVLQLELEYNTAIYSPETIRRICSELEYIFTQVTRNPFLPIQKIALLTPEATSQLLFSLGVHPTPRPAVSLVSLFAEAVARYHSSIALIAGECRLTYIDLDRISGQLAALLVEQYSIGTEDVVALHINRGEWRTIAILAVLKAGAAFVPLDPDYPSTRKAFVLKDAGAKLVLCSSMPDEAERTAWGEIPFLPVDTSAVAYPPFTATPAPGDLAYIIYTSGTTGQPKGVMIEHGTAAAFMQNLPAQLGLVAGMRMAAVANYTFDISIIEQIGTLLTGVVQDVLLSDDPNVLLDRIASDNIDALQITPSRLQQLLDVREEGAQVLTKLKLLWLGGEALNAKRLAFVQSLQHTKVINVYGPTEATIWSSSASISQGEALTIGQPLAQEHFLILDQGGQLCPPGVPGEICIGGIGVGRGYRNLPDVTANVFVLHPWLKGERLYRTGDLGCLLPNGQFTCIGRIDHQMKVNGFRIEPGEIENTILRYPGVRSAIVVANPNSAGEHELAAYFTGTANTTVTNMRDFLSSALPAYMTPAFLIPMDELPLNNSGKVDRKRLPDPAQYAVAKSRDYVAPQTAVEIELIKLWEDILQVSPIGMTDEFFERGGHSLKATRLASRIRKAFGVVLELRLLFTHTTPLKQVALIASSQAGNYPDITPAIPRALYPLSAAQKRLFFLQEFAPDSTGYNMTLVKLLHADADFTRMEQAFLTLIDRHESLRTSFEKTDGIAWQKINATVPFVLEQHTCTLAGFQKWITDYVQPFDLSRAPLLRSAILHIEGVGKAWIVDMHHIISDGSSQQLLATDFMRLYNGEVPERLQLQYKDFSEWQNGIIASGALDSQVKYWQQVFANGVPKLNLATDFTRPAVFNFAGAIYPFALGADRSAKLKALARTQGATLQMTLLAILNVLLHRYTGQDDIVIGSGIAGRRHADTEGIVGMFVNSLALRNYPAKDKTFAALLAEVVTNSLAAYENQDLQFEDLLDHLQVERDASRNPLFDVSLIVQNFERSAAEHSSLFAEDAQGIEYQPGTAKFDMDWFIEEWGDDIHIKVEYYTAIYTATTIIQFSKHFVRILDAVIADPECTLASINLITEDEARLLLEQYVPGPLLPLSAATTIHSLFESHAQTHPHHIAIRDGDTNTSYAALDKAANQLAQFLTQTLALTECTRVGILMNRNTHWIITMMGVLKAGMTYMPMDTAFPEDRLLYMAKDAGIQVVLTEKKFIELANSLQWRCDGLDAILCADSTNFYEERGMLKNDLMRKELWDHIGDVAADAIGQGGWINSYTGEDFTPAEMKEYSDNAMAKLLPHLHRDMRVLEIGCSSGLTMFQVAPHVAFYYGTDLSSSILNKTQQVADEKQLTNIQLSCMPADAIDQLPERDFDLVIINSVIQCFNGHNYLNGVIEKAIAKMKPKGMLFIGDVMDEDKRDEMVADFIDYKKNRRQPGQHTKTDWGMELYVSRQFFEALMHRDWGIYKVTSSSKIATIENELTRYRYDVFLHVDKSMHTREGTPRKRQYDYRSLAELSDKPVQRMVSPDTPACIIYTSGSTGQPKGVWIDHHALVARFTGERALLEAGPHTITITTTNPGFDVSLLETIFPLTIGGTIFVVSKDLSLSPLALAAAMAAQKVTLLQGTPSFISGIFLEGIAQTPLPALTHIAIGGESLSDHLVHRLTEYLPHIQINNQYGPTEVVIDAIARTNIRESRRNIIGRPLPNTRIYILSESLSLLPIGAIGEIMVGGILAGGYIGADNLTAEKFVADPFKQGERLYRTGDLGRFLPDGTIEFIGRKDEQVKIRGYRVEPGEIESAIRACTIHAEVIVLPKVSPQGDTELIAYIATSEPVAGAELKAQLATRLPSYMVPGHFVQMDHLPLTPNGKVNKALLPDPGGEDWIVTQQYQPPRNPVEEKIVEMWQEILGRERVGVTDNFFEIGGHSLRVIRVLSKIRAEFKVDIKIDEMFSQPTVEYLARAVAHQQWATQEMADTSAETITIAL